MHVELNGATAFVGCGGIVSDTPQRPWAGGDAPRMVLLHGAGMDRTVWVLLARYFARHGVDVVAPDLPAHGGSGGDALASIDAMADWTVQLLATLQSAHGLGGGPLVLAGHSMGAFVALESAARLAKANDASAPSVWMLGAGYPMPVSEALLSAARQDSPVAADMIAAYAHAYGSRLGHNDVAGISVYNVARALLLRAAPGVLHTDLVACDDYAGARDAAAALEPDRTHVVGGDQDRMTPPRAAAELASLTGATLHTIADCGHMLMSEQPEAVLQAMRRLQPSLRS